MCTATWICGSEGYELFFNRDELHLRGPEQPPAVLDARGVRALAPRDTDSGGTWIAVNEFGLTLALLNGYVASKGPGTTRPRSRGGLIPALIRARDLNELERDLQSLELEPYPPFSLLAFCPGEIVEQHQWDGRSLTALPAPDWRMPISSSSRDQEGARRFRAELLRTMLEGTTELSAELLSSFHRSHAAGASPLTPCMHREDAATRSHCRIRVRADSVSLAYAAGAPCSATLQEALQLRRQTPKPQQP